MPLIQVDLSRERFERSHEGIGAAIHSAQIEVLDIPPADRFQVFTPRESNELKFDPTYNDVDRKDLLLIRITAVHMYSVALKKSLFANIVLKLSLLGIRPDDILICLTENGFEDWWAGR
jgi:hypothetical protein